MYNVEQLLNCSLSRDTQFIVSKDIVAQKAANAIQNTGSKDLRAITTKLLSEVVRTVPKEMASLATGITQYRLAQELHIPYRPLLNAEQLAAFKTTKMTTDNLLRTVYQSEVAKDRLFAKNEQLENDRTRTVQRVKQQERQRSVGMERE